MKFEDLSEEQQKAEGMFDEFLTKAGWFAYPNAHLIRSGISVNPEGRGSLVTSHARLSLEIFLQEKVLVLKIVGLSGDAEIGLALQYDGTLGEILNWIEKHQECMTRENFAERIKELLPLSREVVFVAEDGTQYELTAGSGSNGRS
jgi:hypothetical protein